MMLKTKHEVARGRALASRFVIGTAQGCMADCNAEAPGPYHAYGQLEYHDSVIGNGWAGTWGGTWIATLRQPFSKPYDRTSLTLKRKWDFSDGFYSSSAAALASWGLMFHSSRPARLARVEGGGGDA